MTDEPISAEAGGAEAGYTLALRPGTRLGERYVVLRLLAGASDFALTYLAHDSRSDLAVVAKELLPRGLVGRSGGDTVRAHSSEAAREFVRVLRRFVREGEILADLRHEALPSVIDVVEDHGTAYLVMPKHDALRLSDHLPTIGGRLTTADAVTFATGLLGALETLHAEGILHREVTPQTVHVRPDGGPLLLGLGAWRHVPGRSREPVAGFDPIEQYGGRDVGPWSDVYGAAAVLYYLVTGTAPVSAIDRAGGAQLRSPGVWARDVSPPMTSAIMRGLALAPDGRPHSASEFRRHLEDAAAMGGEPAVPRAMVTLPVELASHPGTSSGVFPDEERGAGRITLNSFGVVVPRDEGGMERAIKRVVDAAARLTRRRGADRDVAADPADDAPPARRDVERDEATEWADDAAPMPSDAERAAAAEWANDAAPARNGEAHAEAAEPAEGGPPTSTGRRLDPVYDAGHARSATRSDERPVLDVALAAHESEATSVVATGESVAVATPQEAMTYAATPEESTDLAPATMRVLMPARRRRTPLIIGATLAIVVLLAAVIVPTALRARTPADPAARRAQTRQAATPRPVVAAPLAAAATLGADSARVTPQGAALGSKGAATRIVTNPTPRPAPPTRAAPSRAEATADVPRMPTMTAPVLTLPLAPSGSPVIAADLVVDARSRVSVAGEQADQGNYAAARQTLAGAIARLDSAALGASDSESLRGVRREIEAAQKRTADACGAESELRRRHGQPALSCS